LHDEAEGMITAVVTTAANESDMHHINDLVDKSKLKKGARGKSRQRLCFCCQQAGIKRPGL